MRDENGSLRPCDDGRGHCAPSRPGGLPEDSAVRIEVIPLETRTLTDAEFRAGIEDKSGAMIDSATGKPWTLADACNRRGAHIAYNAEATAATETETAVLAFLGVRFAAPK